MHQSTFLQDQIKHCLPKELEESGFNESRIILIMRTISQKMNDDQREQSFKALNPGAEHQLATGEEKNLSTLALHVTFLSPSQRI